MKLITNTWQFSLIFEPHQTIFIQLQVENCDSSSRLVVLDKDVKFRLERVNVSYDKRHYFYQVARMLVLGVVSPTNK